MQRGKNIDFYLVRMCSGKTAYEALPVRGIKFNRKGVVKALIDMGYTVEDFRALIIAKKEIETTIFPSGRLHIKCEKEENASREANFIGSVIIANSEI
ncbi:MAG: hypothetical protein ACP5JR_05135 [Thermoplasmata archaeon]